MSEHKLPAITSIGQRTVPREHINTSLVQLMFILLDTGYLSSFENYALKIPVREKINPKTQRAFEHFTSWKVRDPPPPISDEIFHQC